MRRKINNIISVIYSMIRFDILKIVKGKNFIFSGIQRFSPNVIVELRKNGKLVLGRSVRVHSGTKIKVSQNAICKIEDNVKINYNCMIICHDSITIGEGTEFGPSVFIYDHDHEFDREKGVLAEKFKTKPIYIGKNVWIGASSIILKGAEIEDNCVIGAGSIVNGKVPAGSIFVQKRFNEIK